MIGRAGREGFHTVTPYVMVQDIDAFRRFLVDVFGATETYRAIGSRGGTHLEVQIGDSRIMIGESAGSAAPAYLFLYVDDVTALFDRALRCGAEEMLPIAKGQFQEELGAAFTDPFGNGWFVAHHGPQSASP
ncbi:MAG: hypothetical protein MI724_18170 [Spirochaetales bacterium]|nr:hypothetical protein [Spirochaetales bacterium]